MVHLIYDGCSTSNRLVAEKYRRNGLNRTQLMMVNDFLNVCVLKTVYRLVLLIMVYQDDLLSLCAQ